MATDNQPRERFDDIDWDAEDHSFSLTRKMTGFLATLGAMGALFVADFFLVADNHPTFGPDPGQTSLITTPSSRWVYDISQLDWLFALTLVSLVFFGLAPMYQNPRMTRYYWTNFKKNRPAVISLLYLIFIFVVGILGPLFMQRPELELLHQYQPPMFLTVQENVPIQCLGEVSGGRCGGTWQYPLGTTSGGKDILIIIIYGMQVSMKIGLIASFIVMAIGSVVGTVSAYAGGLVDEVLMRYVDIQQTFPSFLLYLLLVYMFGGSLFLFILIFGCLTWGGNARYVRSNALQKTEEEYIQAAKASGAKTGYIIRRHLIPNTASSIITDLTLLIPVFILAEAQLAFLGLGDSTIPSWGQLIASGRSDLTTAWWIATLPGLFLFATILAFNFLGDAMLDALNPEAEAESEG